MALRSHRNKSSLRRFVIWAWLPLSLAVGRSGAEEYLPGVLHVELVPGASIDLLNDRYGSTSIDSLPPLYQISVPEGETEASFLLLLLADPDVADAEYSWESETPEGIRQMVVTAVGATIEDYLDQGVAERLRLADAHAHARGEGILIAVIDTGVLASHPALQDAIVPGGWDFVDDDSDPADSADGIDNDDDGLTDEGAGHGTMVAGIIHLVAPEARLLPIRVLDDEGQSTTFMVARAIRYALDQGADLVNLSLGLTEQSSVIDNEIEPTEDTSVGLASGAGNLGSEDPEYYPAGDSRVLSIAAVDSMDIKADFSSWHSSVDVSAPGQGILAPYHDGGYAVGAGTSFATAFVTGIAALLQSIDPNLNQDDLYDLVELGTVPIDDLPGNEPYEGELGSGRVDAFEAVLTLLPTAAAGDRLHDRTPRLVISPNPAPAGRTINLSLRNGGDRNGTAILVDALGREAGRIPLSGGAGTWTGRDGSGRNLPAGLYFIRIAGISGAAANLGRVVLLKP